MDEDGTEIGIYALAEAISLAQARSLDLIEIGPGESPPRCCLMDHGKFMYRRQQAQGDGTPTI